MITASLLALAALWIVVLHRYPAYFVPRKPLRSMTGDGQAGENWIEIPPISQHKASSLQEVA